MNNEKWEYFLHDDKLSEKPKGPIPRNSTSLSDKMWVSICNLTNTFDHFKELRGDAQKIINISIGDFKEVHFLN